MANSAASPPANIGFDCANIEEPFFLLDKRASGSPLPSNVIDDVNPYIYEPQNLPEGSWFLISSKESINTEHGFWKTKEEACEVFSNTNVIGWRTTFEYYDSQLHKTDYVMQVFSTTQKRLYDDNENQEISSLCRVFLVPSQEMHQNVSSTGVDAGMRNNMRQAPLPDANSSTRIGSSSSNPEVSKHGEREGLAISERLPAPEHHEGIHVGMDLFSREQIVNFSGGDFLELDDLDNPASPSSSSENSSAMSISSDEYFDGLFLDDLEEPQVVEQNDASRRLNVSASKKSDEVVIVPATLESLVSVEGSNSDKAEGDRRDEGPSSSRKPSTSGDSRIGASASGRKRAALRGMKNLRKKYSCFMPF